MKSATRALYSSDPTQEVIMALRDLLSHNPCAAYFGAEILSESLYEEHYLSSSAAVHEVEYALEALRIEEEIVS